MSGEAINLTGKWKRAERGVDHDDFLRAQGLGWINRKLSEHLPLVREITQEGEHVTKDHQDLKGVVDHAVAYPIHPTPAEGNGARERGHVITENLRGHETELVAWRDGNSIVLHRTFPGQSHQVWYIHTLADENTLLVHYEVEVDNRRVDSSSTFTRCE